MPKAVLALMAVCSIVTRTALAAPPEPDPDDARRVDAEAEPPVHDLPPVTVEGVTPEQSTFESPRAVDRIDAQRRRELQARTIPELLDELPGVVMQRTNRGAGAPILRGLVGPQNLIVVDGVRFNTSTFRTGPLQYLALLDPHAFASIDVVRGPAAVRWGNGAMGGVLLLTPLPLVPTGSDDGLVDGRAEARFATADTGAGGTLDLQARQGDWAVRVGGGYDHHGTLRVGGGDEVPLSAYDVGHWRARLAWAPNERLTLSANYLGAAIYGAGRTDNLGRGEAREYDNVDHLGWLRLAYRTEELLEELRVTASYHGLYESVDRWNCATGDDGIVTDRAGCVSRDLGTVSRLRYYEDQVHAVGGEASAAFRLFDDRFGLRVGVEITQDFVTSSRLDARASSDFAWTEASRGNFSDGSEYRDLGAYLMARSTLAAFEVGGEGDAPLELRASLGARVSNFAAFAPDVPELGEVEYAFTGFAFSAGLQAVWPERLNLWVGFDQGFRAPNLQETTVLGDTGSSFEVPNPDLGPERSDTLEVGARGRIGPVDLGLIYFHSWLDDALDLEDATWKGQSAVEGKPVRRRVNAESGLTQGIEATAGASFWRMRASASVVWTDSELTRSDGTTVPGRRLPPLQGRVGLRYDHPTDGAWAELYTRFSAAQDELHPSDRTDLRICETSDYSGVLQEDCAGTPGWVTVGIRGGARLSEGLRVDLAIENVPDVNYRIHGSGLDAPGIDGRVTLTGTWN